MSSEAETEVRDVLGSAFGTRASATQGAFSRDGMKFVELLRLYELVRQTSSTRVLEVGMATGTSSVVIAAALRRNGGGHLTSIDPFQTAPDGYAAAGIQALRSAGLDHDHTLIEQPDYLALPRLLATGSEFDLVLIDGYHSFDFTMVDLFYADLLLRDLGVVAVHDSPRPAVFEAIRFLRSQKPYEPIGPPVWVELDDVRSKLIRRLKSRFMSRSERRELQERRLVWHSLTAYRKLATRQAAEFVHAGLGSMTSIRA